MDLIFFDLDGTLLNDASEISTFTKETLFLLRDKDIAYTIATGRTMLSAQRIIDGHRFDLPHIYNNGVTIWDPISNTLTLDNLLMHPEAMQIIDVSHKQGITPFVTAIDDDNKHYIFHSKTRHEVEDKLIEKYLSRTEAIMMPLDQMPEDIHTTNISMIAPGKDIDAIAQTLDSNDNLVAYSGAALEGNGYKWIDIHHRLASKGGAVTLLKKQLKAKNIICFGDNANDLSMFALADESYAPENATSSVKAAASSVIGHNHNDGIAHFLRERFSL